MHIRALVSGMPRAAREAARLIVLQAWFDESGKGQPPVYLLAGYLADIETWKGFADDWKAELDRSPTLPYLHANESQLFKGMGPTERIDRLLRFVDIIGRYRLEAETFILKHSDYGEFFRIIADHPIITRAEQRVFRNPYFISFQRILTLMLARQAATLNETPELLEILFDEGIDRKSRVERAFKEWIKVVRVHEPTWLRLLINKTAEFRDDKCFPPLQAADLLAWHLRRHCEYGESHAVDPVWRALREAADPKVHILTEADFVGMLYQMRDRTWRDRLG
jgi:hypothetical protein